MSRNRKKDYTDEFIKVAIVDLGERLSLSLNYLTNKLNSLQSSFYFSVVQPITAARVGEPDIQYEWHESERLFQKLYDHAQIANFDYMIGITHFKITFERETEDLPQKSYFSSTDFKKVSVISINKSMLTYISASKNIDQYVAICIMETLLASMAKKDMCHFAEKYCLFDECEDRSNFRYVLDQGQICSECIAKLKESNVSQLIINDVLRVLGWCSRDSLRYSIILAAKNPLTTIIFGTCIGWLCRAFIESSYYPLVISIMVVVPILVFLSIRYNFRK